MGIYEVAGSLPYYGLMLGLSSPSPATTRRMIGLVSKEGNEPPNQWFYQWFPYESNPKVCVVLVAILLNR